MRPEFSFSPGTPPLDPAGAVWRDRIVLALLVGINVLVLANAVRHSPFVGYDALDHLEYIRVLAAGRLPGPDDTNEFFAAPLPYVVPAFISAFLTDRWGIVVKAAQLQNVAWSIGLTLALVRLCAVLRPGDVLFARWSLLLIAITPVYYKTFAFVRGEPLGTFLAVLAIERVLSVTSNPRRPIRGWVEVGVVIGAMMLAKQWGAFVAIAIALWLAREIARPGDRARALAGGAVLAATIALLVAGWFYVSLHQRFGSVAAFNSEPAEHWSLANRPAAHYVGHGMPRLFTDPVRGRSEADDSHSILPAWYADFWGDRWAYWVVWARDPAGGWASGAVLVEVAAANPAASNRDAIAPYLGRVNAVALGPTIVALFGVLAGASVTVRWVRRQDRRSTTTESLAVTGTALVWLAVSFSVVGYLILLVGYPALAVNASYLLQIVPLVALLTGAALAPLARTHHHAHHAAIGLVLLAGLHHAPLYVTRFPWYPIAFAS